MVGNKGKMAIFLTCFLTGCILAPVSFADEIAHSAKSIKISTTKTATVKTAKHKETQSIAALVLANSTLDDDAMRISTHASTGSLTSIPYGWVDFCGRQPQECEQPPLEVRDIELNGKNWAMLNRVNGKVNSAIVPISNLDHWGTVLDHWDYPSDGKGDCKIYALEKRRQLLAMGFPRQALLMTIVKDQNGQGHTILTVSTSQGDFILDNMTNKILPWSSTGYRYLKRQSQEDPNVWVTIVKPAV